MSNPEPPRPGDETENTTQMRQSSTDLNTMQPGLKGSAGEMRRISGATTRHRCSGDTPPVPLSLSYPALSVEACDFEIAVPTDHLENKRKYFVYKRVLFLRSSTCACYFMTSTKQPLRSLCTQQCQFHSVQQWRRIDPSSRLFQVRGGSPLINYFSAVCHPTVFGHAVYR